MLKYLAPLICLFLGLPPRAAAEGVFNIQQADKLEAGPVGGWMPVEPDDEPDENTPGAPERAGFWDRLQDKAFDQICKNIKLRTSQNMDLSEYGFGGVSVDRRLMRTAAGTFALVDRSSLEAGLSYGQSIFDTAAGPVSISVGSSMKGESVVVRPLGSKESCSEIKSLVNVFDFKTVVPLSHKRLKEMRVGELWKLPLTLHLGVGIGTGLVLADMPASISLGRGKSSRAAVSLYRMAEDKLRLRLRIDKAQIKDRGGSVVYSFPGSALGFPQVEVVLVEQLVKLVNRQAAKTLARYLSGSIGLRQGKRQGRQIMIEYVLDPNDERQMAAMRELMHGDLNALSVLREMLREASRLFRKDRGAREEAGGLRDRHSGGLGSDATFVGADDYKRDGSHFNIKIPILVDFEKVSGRESDHVIVLDDAGNEYDIHRADKRMETGFIDIPFLGELTKHNSQRTAQVMTRRDKTGATSGPAAVFVRQEGFLRENSEVARDMVEEADEIMRLAGTRGEGENANLRLPVDELFPKDDMYEERADPSPRDGVNGGPVAKTYRRGVSAFTLAFNPKAVQDIISAPVEVVYKAFIHALSDHYRHLMRAVMPVAKIGGDGKLEYSREDALGALGYDAWSRDDADSDLRDLGMMAKRAMNVVRDLADVRGANTPEERAEKFLAVLAGDGRSGLAYEDILKVLVQLVDPLDIAGEFFVRVDKKRKGEEDVHSRLVFNENLDGGGVIHEASKNRARFAEPSVLVD